MNSRSICARIGCYSVPDRIVSIIQPYIRPIVHGKAVATVEFGAKMDLSLDEKGMARIEKISFDAYNESDVLIAAAERYFERTGYLFVSTHSWVSRSTDPCYNSRDLAEVLK